VPTSDLPRAQVEGAGASLNDLLVHAGLAASKGEARRAVESGGVYLNNTRVDAVSRNVTTADLLFGQYMLLRKGKRNYALVRVR
jgi:tyrosyl-tRNA synthetase